MKKQRTRGLRHFNEQSEGAYVALLLLLGEDESPKVISPISFPQNEPNLVDQKLLLLHFQDLIHRVAPQRPHRPEKPIVSRQSRA